MAFTGNYMCTSFKVQLMQAAHDFRASGGDTFKIALYTDSASFTAATTAYTATNEITNTSGSAYTAGGATLTAVDPTSSGTTAFTDFADASWSSASFTARGALIYNTTPTSWSWSDKPNGLRSGLWFRQDGVFGYVYGHLPNGRRIERNYPHRLR